MNQNNLEHKQLKIKQKYFLHVGANNQIQFNTKKFGESRLFFFFKASICVSLDLSVAHIRPTVLLPFKF